ncbi:MAG: DUF975 family protein [Lachnospiraceae bacterium]|nr:DUF975 family protein [Lachnospiraceae bacterium]
MKQYESSSNLKDKAKGLLMGHWGTAVLYVISMLGIVFAFSLIIAFAVVFGEFLLFGEETTLLTTIINYIVSGILSCVTGVLNAGTALFFLNIACGKEPSLKNMFYCFTNNSFMKCLAISTATVLPEILMMFPSEILTYLYESTNNLAIGGASVLAGLIGIVIFIPITYALSMSFYLMLDFPERSASDILRLSLKITKGHKRRLLYLDLSFIPLLLLVYCTCGIGFLWFTPYMNMVYVLFFLDLMKPKNNELPTSEQQPYDPFAN